ncbi:MAG TPA: hypothetical protein DCS43_15405 [Verrucomicrobia bacterium]|nr:hypothetical protein [Verrucomicrobiota bacterium]
MDSLKEVRRQNLNLILSSLGGHGAQKKLSEKSGIYHTHISNLRVGHKEMGEEIARKIEGTMGLSSGWMDRPHSEVRDDQGTYAKTATPGALAMEQRLLTLWEQLPEVRRWIALEMLEDMVAATQIRSSLPMGVKN